MLNLRYLKRLVPSNTTRHCIQLQLAKHFHDEFTNDPPKTSTNPKNKFTRTTPAVSTKFNVFSDDNASVILDVEEERQRVAEEIDQIDDVLDDAYSGLNLESELPKSNDVLLMQTNALQEV